MLDIEKFAESGELFDGHYKLSRPLSTDGATADVWTALDTNTMSESVNSTRLMDLLKMRLKHTDWSLPLRYTVHTMLLTSKENSVFVTNT